MDTIRIEHHPSAEHLAELGVTEWPIWEKEVSAFPWQYAGEETCYFLEGRVIVTPEGGEPLEMGRGDLVTFADGLACHWQVLEPVRKHYHIA